MTRSDARWIVVPMTTATFALATLALQLGPLGIAGGAIVGFVWSFALERLASWTLRRQGWWDLFPATAVGLAVICTGLLAGGGFLYGRVAMEVLAEPSTTYAVLSAMMRPTVPYFIALNTLLETLVVPLALYLGWDQPRQRYLLIAAAVSYFAMRVWSYLEYAPTRLEIASRTLTAADVEWYRSTMAADYRGVLVFLCYGLFLLAALEQGTLRRRSSHAGAGRRAQP
jgi:hypothetical protein